MKMLNLVGTPKTKLRAIRANCCVLAVALILGVADPQASSAGLPRLANAAGTLDASDQIPGKAALRPAPDAPAGKPADRALLDIAGWLNYLHRTAGDIPDVALSPALHRPTGTRTGDAGGWTPHPAAAAMATLVAYRPHAPPRRFPNVLKA